jgi:hypothetical protein
MPCGSSANDVGIPLRFKAVDERLAIDEAGVGEVDYISHVNIVTAFEFCKG